MDIKPLKDPPKDPTNNLNVGDRVYLAISQEEFRERVAVGDWFPVFNSVYIVADSLYDVVHLKEDPDHTSYFEARIFQKVD